ncbi:MAG: amino acid adenylation domain-containing protein [Flavobacteriaceae bacterium]|nr:amino acid adenylation domain-containing protein [Flavobacteriaceae bacterium]
MDKDLKNRINQLSPAQLKVLMKKLGKSKKEMPLMPRNEAEEYPVSSAQRRMWFMSKLNPESFLYTNPVGINIFSTHDLDFDRYVSGVQLIAQQHEILRTSFFSREGKMFQKIHPEVPIQINKIDITHIDEAEKESKVLEILKEDGQNVINVEDFPLFRFTQITISDKETAVMYTSHHIISDAWSSTQIFRTLHELSQLEKAPERLPELKYQFIDYVLWENTWLKGDGFQKALNGIKEMISTAPEPINLPLDYKRPTVINYEGALVKTVIDSKLVAKMNQYCKDKNLNVFHFLLATFNVLLHKYSLSNEISVGIPLANRKLKEFQETVGMFLNTLPLVTSISPEQSFEEYLLQVKAAGEKIVTHQDLPFDKLIDELKPERSLAYSPLFQVLFVYQNIPQMYEVEGIRISPVKSDYDVSKYDLDLWIEEVGDQLFLSLTYQTKLFKKETVDQFLKRYTYLLNEVIDYPEKKVSILSIEEPIEPISYAEKKIDYDSYLHAFEEKAQSTPDAIALIYGEFDWSYKLLNEKSNQLAHQLIHLKSDDDKFVVIALDRSENQIISILAIHKAGLAYVPIDLNQPKSYTDFILDDTQVHLIITSADYADTFQQDTIVLDDVQKELDTYSIKNPDQTIERTDLAYLLYTSGTTGKPKGVKIGHEQLVNYSTAVWKRFSLNEDATFGSVSTITTDLGNTQIFPALMHGASLNFIATELITNPLELSSYLKTHRVDCLKIVPSHLASLLKSQNGFEILPRTLLVLGGEKVTAELILKIRSNRPDLRVINHYGPTETSIGILTHEIKDVEENSIIPIGAVLDNNQVFIVDYNNKIVSDGLAGEILICGKNVSLGYHNNQILSEKSFGLNFGNTNDRYYKTGDLGRKRIGGNIEFLGRIDRQQKVRGYRVETEAIELLVQNYEGVVANRVLIDSDSILLYVESEPGKTITPNKIREFLQNQLPSYMVPEQVIIVDQILRLGNGKVDDKKLLLSNEIGQIEDGELINPRDETELFIAQTLKEVLEIKTLSIHDDFFNLGGNSLAAIEIFEKINRRFSTNLGINVLFHSKSIAQLANEVNKAGAQRETSSVVPIRKGTGSINLYFVHPAGGDIMSYYELALEFPEEYNVFGLQSVFDNDDLTTIEEVAKSYLAEIEKTNPEEDLVFGGWSMGAVIAFEMAKQQHSKNEQQIPVLILDQKAPARENQHFEGATGTLERLAVFGGKIDHIAGKKTLLTKENLEPLSESERTGLFLQEFKKYNLVPEGVKVNEFQVFLDRMILHHDMALFYRTETYKGPVLLIKAEDSTFVTDEFENDVCYGWSNYTENDFEIVHVPGNHITIIKNPYAKEVSTVIHTYLNKVVDHNSIEKQEKLAIE